MSRRARMRHAHAQPCMWMCAHDRMLSCVQSLALCALRSARRRPHGRPPRARKYFTLSATNEKRRGSVGAGGRCRGLAQLRISFKNRQISRRQISRQTGKFSTNFSPPACSAPLPPRQWVALQHNAADPVRAHAALQQAQGRLKRSPYLRQPCACKYGCSDRSH